MHRLLVIASVAAAAVLVAVSSSGAAACTITFDGGGTNATAWNVAANWDTNAVPASSDHVCIPNGLGAVLSTNATVQSVDVTEGGSLTLSAGTLTLTSTTDASSLASFTMTGGTLAGGARVVLTGTALWSGGTMQGAGTTAIAPGATVTHDDYAYLDGGRRLEVGGVLSFVADRGIYRLGTTGLVHVLPGGLVRKSGSAGEAWIDTFVENDGTIDATAGAIKLTFGGGADAATGSFGTSGQGGEVRFTGGVFGLADGAELRGGTEIAAGAVAVLDGHTAMTSGAGNEMTGGTIAGPGTFQVGGAFAWSGGTMSGAGRTVIASGATVTHDDYAYLEAGRRLEVAGTLRFIADRGIYRLGTTGLVHVLDGGVVRKSGSAGEAWIDTFVENDGLIDATAGAIKLTFGGGAEAATGDFGTNGQAGKVRVTGGVFGLADGAHFRGGTEIAAGTVEVLDGQTAITSGTGNTMTGGTIGGPGTFQIGGSFAWSGGTMKDSGTTRIAAGATVTHDDYAYLENGRRLEVAGTLSFVADRGIYRLGTTGLVHVLPTGLVRKSGSAGEAWIDTFVDNDGTIDATAGAIKLTFGGPETSAGDFGTSGQGGEVRFTGGTFALAGGAELRGGTELAAGTLEVPAGTVSVSGPGNSMTGGTVSGAGTLVLGHGFLWSGGEMTGAGTTAIPAGATVTHDDYAYLQNGRTLHVAGTLDLVADRGIYREGTAEPAVAVAAGGLIRKSAGAGRGWIDPALRNDGTVRSTSGVLALTRGAGQASTGAFEGSSATDLVSFDSGTHRLGAGTDLAGWTEIDGATVEIPDGATVAADEHVVLSFGTIGGAGTLAVPGELRWRGGKQTGPGETDVPAGGQILVEACAAELGAGRRIDNHGTLRLAGGAEIYGNATPRATILNDGRIELDDASDECFGDPGISGNTLILNTGTIDKLGGTGAGYVTATLDNDGVAKASKGDLRLGSTSAVTHNGGFTSAAGATLTLDSGTFVLGPNATATGTLRLEATLEPSGAFPVPAGSVLRIDGGTLRGAADVTVAGTLELLGGDVEGTGAVIVEPAGTAVLAGEDNFASLSGNRQLVNRGTTTLAGGTLSLSSGASLLNAGSLAITGNAELHGDGFGFGAESLVHNTGALLKSGTGDAEVSAALDNDGTVEVTGGSLYLSAPLNYSAAGDALTGGAYVVRTSGILRLPGPVRALGARLLLDGAPTSVTWSEFTGGVVHDALGLLARVTSAGELQLAGGRDLALTGALANGGAVRLGAGSEVSAAGGYRQTSGVTRLGGDGARVAAGAGQTVAVQGGRLAGRGAAAQILDLDDGGTVHVRLATGATDRIAVPGEARLDGTLQIDTDPGFAPAAGSEHTVLTYGSRTGTFDAVAGLSPRPGVTYALEYRATAVVLKVAGAAAAAATPGASDGAVEGPKPVASLDPVRIDDRSLLARGSWTRVRRAGRTLSVAAAAGASLRARGVQGTSLALVAETCRRCGSVGVYWRGRLLARVSLRSSRRRLLRRLDPGALRGGRGTVELRASGRVAIDALIVR